MNAWNSMVAVEMEENRYKIFWMRTCKIYFTWEFTIFGLADGLNMEQKEIILSRNKNDH